MTSHMDAILFDMSGTLRRTTQRDNAGRTEIVQKILDIIGLDTPAMEFAQLLAAREKAYREWGRKNLTGLNEVRLWTEWMLPDQPAEKVSAIAVELNQLWREAKGTRRMIPETRATILGLYRRGYRLGLVSNTTSSVEIPLALEKEGIAGCFDTVILSCLVGKWKPAPDVLLEAAARIGVRPEACAYVGNHPEMDVAAARSAGFGRTVILRDPLKPLPAPLAQELTPDHFIDNLKELLDIFPARNGKTAPATNGRVYDISLSTMWGMKKFADLGDFFLAAPRLGFSGIELNHQVSPAMLAGIDLNGSRVSSIHEPCPAVIAADVLKKQDLLISSSDEERRREGVHSIQRSIDLAKELGGGVVVVHAGQIQADGTVEPELRSMFEKGQAGSEEYNELKSRFVEWRASLAGPHLAAVKKSMRELLDYAGRFAIRLGIENRYHYFDIPTPDEMGEILELAGRDQLGFLYDVGHAQTQARLGFYPHEAWLERFAGRMIGAHIHDVIGIRDHCAPGLGEVDFRMVAAYLPRDAFRTLEVLSSNTPEQIRAGLEILVDTGCVNLIQ